MKKRILVGLLAALALTYHSFAAGFEKRRPTPTVRYGCAGFGMVCLRSQIRL